MSQTFDSIEEVVQANLCVGCGACSQAVPASIRMVMNGQGYMRPQISQPLQKPEQQRAVAVCPGAEVLSPLDSPDYHPLWGPLRHSRVGWSTDKALRHQASSGGGLSALATFLLEQGKVQAVLHLGVAADDPLRNEFKISLSAADVAANAGSRYAPGAPLTGLLAAIANYERVAVIGKPCDIVAVRKLAAQDARVSQRVAYCLSFMCAGVPSIKGTHAVIRALGFDPAEVNRFRYRGNGWPGQATASTADGRSNGMSYDDSWGKILNRHLQFRCKICIDGTGEYADVTCADAWYGTEDGYPSFEEQEGRSLVLSRNETGEQLVQQAVAAGYLQVEELPVAHIEKMQPYQASRKRLTLSRVAALRLFGRRIPRYSYGFLWRLAREASVKANARSFVGMARRLWRPAADSQS